MSPTSSSAPDVAKRKGLSLAAPAHAALDFNWLKSTTTTKNAPVPTPVHTPSLDNINHQAGWVNAYFEGTQAQREFACKVKAVSPAPGNPL